MDFVLSKTANLPLMWEAKPEELLRAYYALLLFSNSGTTEAKQRFDYSMLLPAQLPSQQVAALARVRHLVEELASVGLLALMLCSMMIPSENRRINAYALDVNNIVDTPIIEHRIKTGNIIPIQQTFRPIP